MSQLRGWSRARAAPVRMSVPTNARIGRATPSSKPATGLPGSRSARVSQVASCAAMMLPPETDVNVSIFASTPSSFSRRSAPRWKSAAR